MLYSGHHGYSGGFTGRAQWDDGLAWLADDGGFSYTGGPRGRRRADAEQAAAPRAQRRPQ